MMANMRTCRHLAVVAQHKPLARLVGVTPPSTPRAHTVAAAIRGTSVTTHARTFCLAVFCTQRV